MAASRMTLRLSAGSSSNMFDILTLFDILSMKRFGDGATAMHSVFWTMTRERERSLRETQPASRWPFDIARNADDLHEDHADEQALSSHNAFIQESALDEMA